VDVLERGDIAFFYRPKVQAVDAVVETPGVQRFFVVLAPAEGSARRLKIGRKRMPEAGEQRFWAVVERVGSFQRVLADQLEAETYSTKTRGERYQPGARAVAQGCYAFVRHGDHTHLAYRVEYAEAAELLPEEVRVEPAASYVVLFEQRGRGRARWTTEGEPGRLDREDAEIVLVGTKDEPERALGIEILPAPDAIRSTE
jgi:hypothetical protein